MGAQCATMRRSEREMFPFRESICHHDRLAGLMFPFLTPACHHSTPGGIDVPILKGTFDNACIAKNLVEKSTRDRAAETQCAATVSSHEGRFRRQ